MLHYIKQIIKTEPYTVTCLFNTGEVRLIDLQHKISAYSQKAPDLFGKLLDKNYFETVHLDSYGTLCWDNEVDFCPDVLYEDSKPVSTV